MGSGVNRRQYRQNNPAPRAHLIIPQTLPLCTGQPVIADCQITHLVVQGEAAPLVLDSRVGRLAVAEAAGGVYGGNEFRSPAPLHTAAVSVRSTGHACFLANRVRGAGLGPRVHTP